MTLTHRNRHVLLVLAALATFALLAPVWPGARVAVATGAVELGRGEPPQWQPAATGDALGAGDRVRTGEDGRAEIALEGTTVRLYPNSLLRVPQASTAGAAGVELDRGTSLFDVLRRGEPFEVRTPEVVVSVKGTRFAVALEADLAASVSVFRGLVGVRSDDAGVGDPETLVQAGFGAFGRDEFELSWLGADDPWESWGRGSDSPSFLDRHEPRRDAALQDAYEAARGLALELPQQPRVDEDRKLKDVPAALAPSDSNEDLKPGKEKNGVVRDVVSKVDEKLEHKLEERYVERVLNVATSGGNNGNGNGNGGGSVTTPLVPLTINYVDGSGQSGGDRVEISDPAGNSWTLDEDDVEDVADGVLSLPPNLAALVQARGLTDSKFAKQLEKLFD